MPVSFKSKKMAKVQCQIKVTLIVFVWFFFKHKQKQPDEKKDENILAILKTINCTCKPNLARLNFRSIMRNLSLVKHEKHPPPFDLLNVVSQFQVATHPALT